MVTLHSLVGETEGTGALNVGGALRRLSGPGLSSVRSVCSQVCGCDTLKDIKLSLFALFTDTTSCCFPKRESERLRPALSDVLYVYDFVYTAGPASDLAWSNVL